MLPVPHMIKPIVPKSFIEMMKLVRPGLDLAWIGILERFVVVHKHEYTGARRIVTIVQNADGSYRLPDQRDIVYLSCAVAWDIIDKYPDFKDLGDYLIAEKKNKELKKKKDRRQWIRDYIRDNRKGIIQAVRNMWERGHTGPDKSEIRERKKRIQIEVPGQYQSTPTGLIVPVDIHSKGPKP